MLVGVDVGTTNLKVLAIDPDTMELVAHAARPVETDVPRPDYAEQNPDYLRNQDRKFSLHVEKIISRSFLKM
ncbi:FGGY family carbohydrate kinase [Fibrella sp. ES10-3-2-2]